MRRNTSNRLEEGPPSTGGPPPAPRSRRRWALAAVLAAVVLVTALVSGGLLLRGSSSGGSDAPPGPKTAVIVDQLSLTVPNPDFVRSARETLKDAGYIVDYFPGRQVSVDFYRELPTHGYDLILLRVHSSPIVTESGGSTLQLSLFTGEPYTKTDHIEDQRARSLGESRYYEGADPLFGITTKFVTDSMKGRFDGALIVAMGCDGLRYELTAQAFLEKGASAFVSWSDFVSAAHTDAATERLLDLLLADGLGIASAVEQTAAEIGPDPSTGAELRVLTDGG